MIAKENGMQARSQQAKMESSDRLRPISGRHNALLKQLRRGFTRAELDEDGYCSIEGARILDEAIRSGLRFKAVFVSESGQERARKLLPQLAAQAEALLVPDKLFASAVPSEAPQGVAALVRLPQFTLMETLGSSSRADTQNALVLLVAGLQDPGNLGTLLRSAEAFGATGVLLGEGTVSPYNHKAMRAAAGSLFRLPVVRGTAAEFIAALRSAGVRLLATSSHKGTPLPDARLDGAVTLIVGGEGAGVPRHALAEADEIIAIPHARRVESLNAGVAASIILYEAARQRRAEGQAPAAEA
jgi:RNA methyltransferase, TrmH family